MKTASAWSFNNKFESAQKLAASDTFGYVAQLCGTPMRTMSSRVDVLNKNTMEFKFVLYDIPNKDEVVQEITDKVVELEGNEFRRCYEPVEEFYRRKPTGNKKLSTT